MSLAQKHMTNTLHYISHVDRHTCTCTSLPHALLAMLLQELHVQCIITEDHTRITPNIHVRNLQLCLFPINSQFKWAAVYNISGSINM